MDTAAVQAAAAPSKKALRQQRQRANAQKRKAAATETGSGTVQSASFAKKLKVATESTGEFGLTSTFDPSSCTGEGSVPALSYSLLHLLAPPITKE